MVRLGLELGLGLGLGLGLELGLELGSAGSGLGLEGVLDFDLDHQLRVEAPRRVPLEQLRVAA